MPDVFSVPIFFICFRESLEAAIIVSVLLSFLKQAIANKDDPVAYKKLVTQVWVGVGVGLAICIVIGAGMIGAFYGLDQDVFSGTEDIWEGVFGLVASLIITLMGAALLRVSKLQDKWRVKLAKALEENKTPGGFFKRYAEKYAMFFLPFITVLREGLEAVVFIGGVSLSVSATAVPLAAICGLAAGCLVGFLIYKGANAATLQIFLIISTCFLYLVAAGLFSRAIWSFENNAWNSVIGGDASEVGSGPGSYDIRQSVWHVNCCNPELNGGGGWGIFNAILGWQNSATYGSVIGYCLYWLCIIVGFSLMGYHESRGHWPLMKPKTKPIDDESPVRSDEDFTEVGKKLEDSTKVTEGVREVARADSNDNSSDSSREKGKL